MNIFGTDYVVLGTISVAGAKSGHETVKCECNMTVRGCRCIGPHSITVVACTHGKTPVIGPNAKTAEDSTLLGVVHPPVKPETPRPEDQQLPKPNGLPSMHDKAREDLAARRELGVRRYGVALQPSNGRDAIRDAYEEALDGSAYGAQAVWEQDNPQDTYVGVLVDLILFHHYAPRGTAKQAVFPTGMFVPEAVVSLLESNGFSVSTEE